MASGKCVGQDEYSAGYSSDYADYVDCDTDNNTTGGGGAIPEGYNTNCTTSTGTTRNFCLEVISRSFSNSARAQTAEALDTELYGKFGGTLDDEDENLSDEDEEVTAILYSNKSGAKDSDGYYESPEFDGSTDLDYADNIVNGDVGIYYDKLYDSVAAHGHTYVIYNSFETVSMPTITTENVAELIEISEGYVVVESAALDVSSEGASAISAMAEGAIVSARGGSSVTNPAGAFGGAVSGIGASLSGKDSGAPWDTWSMGDSGSPTDK
jgi:hypothetical protein